MNKEYIKEDIDHFWATTDLLFVPAIHYQMGHKHYKAVKQGLQDKHTRAVQSFKPWQVKTFETIKSILN
jgi:hypothetical protein